MTTRHIVYVPEEPCTGGKQFRLELATVLSCEVDKIDYVIGTELGGSGLITIPETDAIVWFVAHTSPGGTTLYGDGYSTNDGVWQKGIYEATNPLLRYIGRLRSSTEDVYQLKSVSIRCWMCWSSLPALHKEDLKVVDDYYPFIFSGPRLGRGASTKMLDGTTKGIVEKYRDLEKGADGCPVAEKIANVVFTDETSIE
ncbi:MAG: hypothetical protein AAGJ08_15950 [Cyanobacteria bacterium P01_H01_bin.35]